MSDSDIGSSPGRQRRSLERSRENIRGYVKLLGKKVTDSPPGQKSSHTARDDRSGSTSVTPSSNHGSGEKSSEGERSPSQVTPPEKKGAVRKESPVSENNGVSPNKSPKAKRKLEIKTSDSQQEVASDTEMENRIGNLEVSSKNSSSLSADGTTTFCALVKSTGSKAQAKCQTEMGDVRLQKVKIPLPKTSKPSSSLQVQPATGSMTGMKESLIFSKGKVFKARLPANRQNEGPQTPILPTNQEPSPVLLKAPLYDYADIETEEVVVGDDDDDDKNGQTVNVGELSADVNLQANEEIESSSEDDNSKMMEFQPVVKKEHLSPEGRVALDHSYSSGSGESSKGSSSAWKKSSLNIEKTLHSRPVYSSGRMAKRSLDIMLHNDKIHILRQMSKVFNDEKPVQPETDNSGSSSDGEGDDDAKEKDSNVTSEKQNDSSSTVFRVSSPKVGDLHTDKSPVKTSNSSHVSQDSSAAKAVCEEDTDLVPTDLPLTSDDLSPHKGTGSSSTEHTKKESNTEQCKSAKLLSETKSVANKNTQEDTESDEDALHLSNEKTSLNSSFMDTSFSDSPFLGFPDPDPKVHHVPSYTTALEEKIQVQSTVGPNGETVDIIDGFSFISFYSQEEMLAYRSQCSARGEKKRPWLRKRRKKRKRLIKMKRRHQTAAAKVEERSAPVYRERSRSIDPGAFARYVNLSYTLKKICS